MKLSEPYTTTHDSIPAETGKNDGDGISGDCISRQAAIEPESISEWKKEFREYVDSLDIARDDWKGIIEYIDELPSAQPERIKGHWIAITSWNNTYKCSVCGRLLVNITDGKNKVAKNYPYCHCGADMRGKTE